MNTVIISGNITRDPEVRFGQSGSAMAEINVAVNEKWKDRDGKLQESVSFIGVKAFGKQAEVIGEHFRKGSPILVLGKLRQESWEDKSGAKRSKTIVIMDRFEFMGGRPQRDTQPSLSSPTPGQGGMDDDEPPFHHQPRIFNMGRLA